MLDRLIDLLVSFIDLFRFWIIVEPYEQIVVTRLGPVHRVLKEPGFYWKLPFQIDRETGDVVVPAAHDMPMQCFTLSDGTTVAVGPVITFRTSNVEKLLMEADNAEAAVRDAARGTIRETLQPLSWEELLKTDLTDMLTKAVRKMAWKWGVEVLQVSLADMCKVKVLRVITGG